MRIRWFGDPWPDADLRAPVCDDDRYRIPAPVGQRCIGCPDLIAEGERGVVMGAYAEMPEGFDLDGAYVCAEHIDCHLRTILDDEMAATVMEQAGVTRVPE